MSKLNTMRVQKTLELAEIDGRKILKDLVEVEISISEYKKTLESLLYTLNGMRDQFEDESTPF